MTGIPLYISDEEAIKCKFGKSYIHMYMYTQAISLRQ